MKNGTIGVKMTHRATELTSIDAISFMKSYETTGMKVEIQNLEIYIMISFEN